MVTLRTNGDFSKISGFLEKAKEIFNVGDLNKYGEMGVEALKAATPKDTGKTADSWFYEIKNSKNEICIKWKNSNVQNGVNIAVLLQFGHGTRNGGYVSGVDYVSPALAPIFQEIAKNAWEEVSVKKNAI